MPTLHLLIKGKVQGVFYRASAKKCAITLSLNGWIRNTESGDVESMVTGSDFQLQQFKDWCWQGPARAQVKEIIETKLDEIVFISFSIR